MQVSFHTIYIYKLEKAFVNYMCPYAMNRSTFPINYIMQIYWSLYKLRYMYMYNVHAESKLSQL